MNKKNEVVINPNDIVYTKPKHSKTISHKNIHITTYAMQIASSKLGISSIKNVQRIAANARHNGLNMANVTMSNYSTYGLDFPTYQYLKNKSFQYKDTAVFFYKGCFWLFYGKNNKSLDNIIYLEGSDSSKTKTESVIDRFFAQENDSKKNRNHSYIQKNLNKTRPNSFRVKF